MIDPDDRRTDGSQHPTMAALILVIGVVLLIVLLSVGSVYF